MEPCAVCYSGEDRGIYAQGQARFDEMTHRHRPTQKDLSLVPQSHVDMYRRRMPARGLARASAERTCWQNHFALRGICTIAHTWREMGREQEGRAVGCFV